MLYLKLQFGDPFLFTKAHQEWCTVIGQCKITFFIYSAFVLLMPLATGMPTSMISYVLVAFPVFFIIPKIVKLKWLVLLLAVFLSLLQLRFISLFWGFTKGKTSDNLGT